MHEASCSLPAPADMAFSGTLKSTTGFPYLLATSGKDKRVRLWKQP